FGRSARPKLPDKISKFAWKPDPRPEDQLRRSIYVLAQRNMRYPLFDALDLPDMHNSCARRSQTTTAPQALLLLNGDFTLERAQHWCAALAAGSGDDRTFVVNAYRGAWGRPPGAEEAAAAAGFLRRRRESAAAHGGSRDEAAFDFCHALLNANEFLYVD